MTKVSRREKLIRRVVLALIIAVVVVVVRQREDIERFLSPVFDALLAFGPWAPVIFALLYVPACAAFLPNSFLSPIAGYLFGPVLGTITAVIGLTIGSSSNFLLARAAGRSWFDRNALENPKFRAVDLACRHEGLKIVFLTRLTPAFPSTAMSYGYGVTSVSLSRFAVGTLLGMTPRTIVCTMLGTAAKSLSATSETTFSSTSWQHYALYAAGIVVTVLVVLAIGRIARRALDEALEQQQTPVETPAVASLIPDLPSDGVAAETAT